MNIPFDQLDQVLDTSKLPKITGVYFVYKKKDLDLEKPLYIGSATGKNGLYGRIHTQHLNNIYTETRFSKDSIIDAFQVSCTKFNKQNKQYIDKSSLRKAIGRTHKIAPGNETAQYIREHFTFYTLNPLKNEIFTKQAVSLIQSIIPNIDNSPEVEKSVSTELLKGVVLALETLMINKYKPVYNTQNKA
jgi:hypothetical protein